MRGRMAAAMVLLALVLFPLGAWLIVDHSFDLTMERERSRALSEEAAIARAVALEIKGGDYEVLYAVASGVQRRYGSDTLRVALVYRGALMAGAQIPYTNEIEKLSAVDGRATLLDGDAHTLYIAHRLSDDLSLMVCSDVSAVYRLRGELAVWAGGLSLGGVLLSGILSLLVSGWLARPYKLLAQQRQELIDALAHEMRTPLTAIVAGSDLMRRASLPESEKDALLETMGREARRLADMDERLLLLTKIEHEAPKMEIFSSMEMAMEAISVFDGVALEGEDAPMHAERELTIQLLRNLVVNALRAGGDEPVRVTLHADGFSVSDSGCGMTKEQIARAFDPFYRADKSRARAAGGAGLGLTLCHRIAQLHGGRLDIESEIGRGTRIVYKFDTTR